MKTKAKIWFGLVEKKSNLVNGQVYDHFKTAEEYEDYLVLLEAVETTDLSVAVNAADALEKKYGVPLEVWITEENRGE